MTTYRISLWPGAGVKLESYVVEAFDVATALDELAKTLRGSAYVISWDAFDRLVEEEIAYGTSSEEAEQIVSESWMRCDEGICLYVMNMQIEKIPEKDGRASENRKPLFRKK